MTDLTQQHSERRENSLATPQADQPICKDERACDIINRWDYSHVRVLSQLDWSACGHVQLLTLILLIYCAQRNGVFHWQINRFPYGRL